MVSHTHGDSCAYQSIKDHHPNTSAARFISSPPKILDPIAGTNANTTN
jgi:hypothetical protein